MTTPTANAILMSGGGSFASFKNHGDTITGTIINVGDPYQVREYNQATRRSDGPLKFTKAGKPVYAFHVTVSTDERDAFNPEDDGTRIIDVNSWRMQDALRNAIRGAGAQGLEVGARVTVSYTGDEVPGDDKSGKQYQAAYERPANVALMGATAPAVQAPVVQVSAPPTVPAVTPPAPTSAPVAAAASTSAASAPQPAQPAPGDDLPGKVKQLIALGLTDEQIAAATGLEASVVAVMRTA